MSLEKLFGTDSKFESDGIIVQISDVMAFKIAEHKDVRIPTMVNYDGFIISHTADSLMMLDDDDVKDTRWSRCTARGTARRRTATRS